MTPRNVNLTEDFERWLRAAVKEGLEDIEGGHYTTLRSDPAGEIRDFMREVRKEASDDTTRRP